MSPRNRRAQHRGRRVDESLLWRWLLARASGKAVLDLVDDLAADYKGKIEPQRLRPLCAAFDAADEALRRRWLTRLSAPNAATARRDELMSMRVVEFPHAGPGLSACHPDLAIVTAHGGSLDDRWSWPERPSRSMW